MKRTRQGQEIKETHVANIFALIRDILSDKSVEAISYEDRHMAVTLNRRAEADKEVTVAIGFTDDSDKGNDNYEEGNE